MNIKASELHKGNLGQVIALDIVDDLTGEDHYVAGILGGFERTPNEMVLHIGSGEYEVPLRQSVSITRSIILTEVMRATRPHLVDGLVGA